MLPHKPNKQGVTQTVVIRDVVDETAYELPIELDLDSIIDGSIARNKWLRWTCREFLGKSIDDCQLLPTDAPLRQASDRMELPDGRLWCTGCKSWHPKSEFSPLKIRAKDSDGRYKDLSGEHSRAVTQYAKQGRKFRYCCKDWEAAQRSMRYYGKLGDKALKIIEQKSA